jgi:hypothetical protein
MTELFKFIVVLLFIITSGIIIMFFVIKKKYLIKILALLFVFFIDFKYYKNVKEKPYLINTKPLIEEIHKMNINSFDSIFIENKTFYKGDTLLLSFFKYINMSSYKNTNGVNTSNNEKIYVYKIYYKNITVVCHYIPNSFNFGNIVNVYIYPGPYLTTYLMTYPLEKEIQKILYLDSLRRIEQDSLIK